jgi:hypothetical protein
MPVCWQVFKLSAANWTEQVNLPFPGRKKKQIIYFSSS